MAPCAVLGWVFYFYLFRTTPGQDWMVFDTAAQAYFRGDTGLLLDGPRFTGVLNATHGWLAEPLKFHPWVYPPYTLLLALPFAMLPWWADYGAFQLLSFAGLVASLSLWAQGRRRLLLIGGVIACAATPFTLGSGQNSFLSAGLVTAGIWFLRRRPWVSGVLLGLLAFKPQLAILVPVALVAARAWPVIAAASLTVGTLLGASLLMPGIGLWRAWLHLLLGGDPAFHQWINGGRLYGQSVYACARLAGLSESLASSIQLAATAGAAACVYAVFRRQRARPEIQLAALLCAMIVAAPHVGNYDALMLGEACMFVLIRAPLHASMLEVALAVAVWCSLSFQPPFIIRPAVVTPLLVSGFMFIEVWRAFHDLPAKPHREFYLVGRRE